ncbi:MAG: hypothetical protein RL189_2912 [Pseudomonadota bacterium]|jgi:muramidase (phage lysozyme)
MKFVKSLSVFALMFALVGCGRADMDGADFLAAGESGPDFIVIGNQKTFLKKTTENSSDLSAGSEKCEIPAGMKVLLQGQPTFSGNHYYVKTADLLPNCSFHNGYVFTGDVSGTSIKLMFSANMHAFLDVIAYAEGTDRQGKGGGYNVNYSHTESYPKLFSDMSKHPRWLICSGYCSDAAGRYQIKSDTWGDVRRELNLPDFSPRSQDRAAVQLIKWRGGHDDVERIDGPNSFSDALYAVRYEWASLPHSPYGQPIKTVGELWAKFKEYRERY